MDNKELIWVDKKFAELWKKLESDKTTREEQDKIFEEYMQKVSDSVRSNFRANLEGLEEDAAIFSGLILKVKQSFEKAKNEHLDASYAVWEKFESEKPSITKKTNEIIDILKPLTTELKTINGLIEKINSSAIERLNDSLSAFSNLYGKNKDMIDFLIKNFKTEEAT